jgi:hypothetical protein
MSFTYTNRKGIPYYLCQMITKTGKIRYVFAREPKTTPVEEIPAGYQVEENVNGQVSLAKARPQMILPEELARVEAALKKHPKGYQDRAAIQNNQIIIYESQGGDFAEMLAQMGINAPEHFGKEFAERHAHFSPIMRFILEQTEARIFNPQRWCFRGSIDGWINVSNSGKIEVLAKELVPTLGTEEFFELY